MISPNPSVPEAPFVQTRALEKLTKLLAAENITIQHSQISTAYFDTKNRVLMLPFWKNMTEVKYRLLTAHEVGHALETKDTDWKRHSSDRKRVGLMNVLEDARIESLMKSRFPGVRSDFFRGYQEFFDEDFFAVKKFTKTPDEFKNLPFPSRLNLHAKIGAFTKVPFSEKEKPFVDRMMALRTFPELEVLMEDILRFIAENKKAEEKKKAEQPEKDPETGIVPTESNDAETKSSDQDENEDEPSPSDDSGKSENESEPSDQDEEDAETTKSDSAPEEGEPEDSDEDGEESATGEPSGSDDGFNSSETDETTQEAFDNNLERMRDYDAAVPRYIKIPEEYDLKDFILPWKNFLEILRIEEDTTDRSSLKNQSVRKFRSFMSATNPVVSYMIKEFETKKSADRFSRQRQAKTGVINPSKLHAYKTESDIFRRLTVLPEDKSHGLVMFIDFSSSMWTNLEGTMMQLLNLVVFCRKVGIPHRVYGFTDGRVRSVGKRDIASEETMNILRRIDGGSASFSSAAIQKIGYIDVRTNLKLLELFSEKMRNNEFADMARMLLLISTSASMASGTFGLHGTPLYETMIIARKLINNFRLETKAQIVNTIFLTDGDGRGLGGMCTDGSIYSPYGTHDMIIMDPQTKRQMICKSAQDMATFLMIALQDVTGTRAVSFRIEGSAKRCAEKAMNIMNGVNHARFRRPSKSLKNLRIDPSFDKIYEGLRADKMFVIPGGEGYAEYYMIVGGDELKTEANTFNTTTKSGDKIGKISNAFVKSNRGRGTSRVLLGRFVAIIA